MGVEVKVQVNTDSSAAKSIVSRRGAARVPCIEVRDLWALDLVAKGELSVAKVTEDGKVARIT